MAKTDFCEGVALALCLHDAALPACAKAFFRKQALGDCGKMG